MLLAIKWAREQKIPYLGICLGFQLAVIEWARNVCGFKGTSNLSFVSLPRRLTVVTLKARTRRSSTQIRNTPSSSSCPRSPRRIWVALCDLGCVRLCLKNLRRTGRSCGSSTAVLTRSGRGIVIGMKSTLLSSRKSRARVCRSLVKTRRANVCRSSSCQVRPLLPRWWQ